MLGLVTSTLAFSGAFYGLNHYFNKSSLEGMRHSKLIILLLATLVSMGVGWMTDKLDGDADLPQHSMVEVLEQGDPVQIAKMLVGIP